jgi:hypothetical protein
MSLANTRGDDPTDPVLRLQDVEAIVQAYFCEGKDGDEPGSVCEINERYWQAHQATTKELLAKSMKESWAAFVFCGGTSSAYSTTDRKPTTFALGLASTKVNLIK